MANFKVLFDFHLKPLLEVLLSCFISDSSEWPDNWELEYHINPLEDFVDFDLLIMDAAHKALLACQYAHNFKHACCDLSIGHWNYELARTKHTRQQWRINQLKQVSNSFSDLLRRYSWNSRKLRPLLEDREPTLQET